MKNLVLVECWGEEYNKKLPKTMTIELKRKQKWALGTEATLDTKEENEAVQVDTIQRLIMKMEIRFFGHLPLRQRKDNNDYVS